jgi:O-antigen/teichoic acid export membrane protein
VDTAEHPLGGALRFGRLFNNATLVIGSAAVANLFSYFFHFVLSRKLGPAQYGTLATMIAVAAMLGVIGASIGTVAMQEAARMWGAGRSRFIGPALRRLSTPAAGLGLLVGLVLGIAGSGLGGYVKITAAGLWWLLAAYVGLSLFAGFARGGAQGAHRFGVYALSVISEGAAKIGLSLGLVALGFSVAGALGGLIGSAALALAIAYFPVSMGGGRAAAPPDRLELTGRTLKILAVSSATTALLYADMLFAKHHFSAVQAGFFGAAGTIARTIPYGAGLVMPMLSPLAAAARHTSRASLAHVLRLVAVCAAVAIGAAFTLISLLPATIIHVTYGSAFAGAAPLLRIYAIDEALLAAFLLGVSYLVAIGEYSVVTYLALAVIVEAGCMAALGTTPERLLTVAIAVNALLVPVVWWLAARSLGRVELTTEDLAASTAG